MAEHRLDAAVLTVNGRPLPPELYARLLLARVEESVQLPDAFEVRFEDAHFALFDAATFTLGDRVVIAMRAEGDPVQITAGEVTGVALEQGAAGRHELVVSGFDVAHRLAQAPKRRSFQRMSDADIARLVAQEYSLEPDVDGAPEVLDHVLQSNETDLSFLRRRADRIGFDCWVTAQTLHFKRKPSGVGEPPALRWGENLLRFDVRFSATERCDEVVTRGWDPLGKRSVLGHARDGDLGTDAPAAAQLAGAARTAFGTVQRYATGFPVGDQAEADAFARSLMLHASGEQVFARGEATGDPLIGAGMEVKVERVGTRLTGRYRTTSVTHVFGSQRPYVTRFVCGGKEARSLTDLLGARASSGTAQAGGLPGLVIGQVTNVDDPEHLCRVKVKFPALSDEDESTWARLASPGAGRARGLQWVPEINDEVLVGFEMGDTNRPIVIAGLWNRTDAPPEARAVSGGEVQSRVLASRKNSRLTFTDDPRTSVELVLGDAACRVHLEQSSTSLEGAQKVVVTGQQIEIKATESVTISAPRISVGATAELKATGSPIRLN